MKRARGEKGAVHGLFDADEPGADGVDGEVDAHVLDIRECGMLQIADQVGRHPEDPADFIHLELSGFQELRFIVGHGHGLKLHAFFQNGHPIRVG